MRLLPPVVVGPLSECNTSVEVTGQLTGATVSVFSDRRLVARGVATWSQQTFPLLPGAQLKRLENVTATQDDGTGPSEPTPGPFLQVQVAGMPGPLSLKAPVHGCGEAVWVTGATPGATVSVAEGATLLGTTDAPHGEARLLLAPMVSRGGVLHASQTACGARSGDTPFPPAEDPPNPLPTPKLIERLLDCDRAIGVTDALVGALVTIERSSGITHTAYFDYPAILFTNLTPPLKQGETVTVRQEFAACQLRSSTSKPATVGPHLPIPTPQLLGRVCAGSYGLRIANLRPGSRVRIFSDGMEIGQAEAPERVFTFSVPALTAGAEITAQQELCGVWSASSNKLVVGSGDLVEPEILGPLIGCGGVVRVRATPGSWVILDTSAVGFIARVFATESEIDVPVSPLLIAGDSVTPGTVGCGGNTSGRSVIVGPPPQELRPPGIGRIMQLMTTVPVTGVVPGAAVDVYVNGTWRGSAFVSQSSGQIAITGELAKGDAVTARQRLCATISQLTVPPVVVQAPPVAAFTAAPTSGEAPLVVAFTDRSSGPITAHRWDFDNNGSIDSTATGPSFTYRNPGVYTAKLTVEGPGGTSSTTAAIHVMTAAVGFDQVAITNCNAERRAIHVWTRDITAGADWSNEGILDDQHDEFGACPVGAPKIVTLTDKHVFEIACVDSGLLGCPGDDPRMAPCRRSYVVVPGKKGGGTLPLPVG